MPHSSACPGSPGYCKCPEHYGLAEYMLQITGKDYGLSQAPKSAPRVELLAPESVPVIAPVRQLHPKPVRQPWDARPARAA